MVKRTELSIVNADADSGDVKLALMENYDPESIRAFLAVVRQKAGGNPSDVQSAKLSISGRTDMEVAGGMTRVLREQSTTSSDNGGNTMVIKQRKDVTVTPAH